MFKLINSIIIVLLLSCSVLNLNAQENMNTSALYIGKWVNISEKSDIIEIQKLKTGYLFIHKNKSYLAYITNNVLFVSFLVVGGPQIPCLINNKNQLIWTTENEVIYIYNKIK